MQTGFAWTQPLSLLGDTQLPAVFSKKVMGHESDMDTWSATVAQHDGRTGAPLLGGCSISPVSGAQLLISLNALLVQLGRPAFERYIDAKQEGSHIRAATPTISRNASGQGNVKDSLIVFNNDELST